MKLFNIWDVGTIKVKEKALTPYVFINPVLVPRSGGRAASGQRIWVQKNHIVERLMNKLMIPGHRGKKHKLTSYHCTGKSNNVYKIVKETFNIIEKETKQNPVQVFITALENGAPREEVTSIEYGGARYSKAVDVSPLRRVNLALRWILHGSSDKAFNKKKTLAQGIAEEIMLAADKNGESFAMRKKNESEKQADSAR